MQDASQDSNEEWRPVVGYEGWYEISNQGQVKRVAGGRGVRRPILNPTVGKVGYKSVTLSTGTAANRPRLYVHSLVAGAFIGVRPPGYTVNHKDGDKLNNFAANLEYVTRGDNLRHAARIGLLARGERCGNARVTEAQVLAIREMKGRLTYAAIAKLYGIGNASAWRVANGVDWGHVTAMSATCCNTPAILSSPSFE